VWRRHSVFQLRHLRNPSHAPAQCDRVEGSARVQHFTVLSFPRQVRANGQPGWKRTQREKEQSKIVCVNRRSTMSDHEDSSTSPCNTTRASPTSAAPSHPSAPVAIPHEDDLCERRRQQNREAQRRFRSQSLALPLVKYR
jgi:hypothetical protein